MDPNNIEKKYKYILNLELRTKKDLDFFCKEFFELFDKIDTEGKASFINWTRYTNKKEYEDRFRYFFYNIEPLHKNYMHLIFVKLKKSRVFRYLEDVFRKNIEAEIKTFNEKNIELSKREEEYKLKYGKLNSKFVFEFEGKKLTLSEIVSKFRSKNRDVRERAFKTMYRGIYQKREEIHHILENLIKIRTQKAINSGFENYRDFRWIELLKFYYTPDDTERYREGVIKEVVPLYEELLEELKTRLKIRNLRPWDVNASMFKKGEFKFFKNHREFLKLGLETANLIDPYFAEVLDVMNKNDRLDLMARKNKQQGGYMTYTQDIRLPFIFMNASGTLEDFMTLMHELGHAVNYMLSRDIENPFLRTPVSEFAEVASIGMEFFALEELKNKLSEDVYIDFMARYILNILKKFIHIGKIDGFQHFIYLYPDLKPEDRDDYFVELDKKLSPSNVKWDRFEKWRNVTWYKQIHIFEYPFYYIDYGIAQIGALNLWKFYRENKSRAIEFYKKGFSSGGTKSLPELYKSTGIEFRFDRRAIANVVKHLKGVCKEIKILKN